jgi:DNA repair exonuclease SbcCD ATPase subunit
MFRTRRRLDDLEAELEQLGHGVDGVELLLKATVPEAEEAARAAAEARIQELAGEVLSRVERELRGAINDRLRIAEIELQDHFEKLKEEARTILEEARAEIARNRAELDSIRAQLGSSLGLKLEP